MRDRRSESPGAVSDQNGEEAESALRDDRTHPEPRTKHKGPERGSESDAASHGTAEDRSQCDL